MFNKVPVVINTFNVELRAGIDYISTRQGPVTVEETAATEDIGFDVENVPSTWAPTLSTVSVGVIPVYSRDSLKMFSLSSFAKGTLGKETGIGFI